MKRSISGTLVRSMHAVAPILALVTMLVLPWLLPVRYTLTEAVRARNAVIGEAFAAAPWSIRGGWMAIDDVAIPGVAIDILNPNAVVSRSYQKLGSNLRATFVLLHCGDARDLLGHYPPRCYPNSGWQMEGDEVLADALEMLPGVAIKRYDFSRSLALGQREVLRVLNFFILPDGSIVTDFDQIAEMASRAKTTVYGAAEVQLVLTGETSIENDTQILNDLLRGMEDLFAALDVQMEEREL